MSNVEEGNKVLMFSTPSCGGCAVIKPILISKGADIEVVDALEEPERADKHNANSFPVFVEEDTEGNHVQTIALGAQECMAYLNKIGVI